jgi:hypothetical protein
MWGVVLSAITIGASVLGQNKSDNNENSLKNFAFSDVKDNRLFFSGAGEGDLSVLKYGIHDDSKR